jgi:mono/diheme cytochrome c family protein
LAAVFLVVLAAHANGAGSKGVRGEDVFNAYCARCHGMLGAGTDKGPPLVHRIYEPNHHSDMSFRWAMERGVRAHHWAFGDMPRIEGLSPEDADIIIGYVRSLQKEAGIY